MPSAAGMGGRREWLVMTIFRSNHFYVLDIGWGLGYCIIILIQWFNKQTKEALYEYGIDVF